MAYISPEHALQIAFATFVVLALLTVFAIFRWQRTVVVPPHRDTPISRPRIAMGMRPISEPAPSPLTWPGNVTPNAARGPIHGRSGANGVLPEALGGPQGEDEAPSVLEGPGPASCDETLVPGQAPDLCPHPTQAIDPITAPDESEAPETGEPNPSEKPDPVEFSVFAPSQVALEEPFPINVNIDFYKDEHDEKGVQGDAYETVIIDVKKGSLVSLGLESAQLQIDAPYQILQWEGQQLTAVFVVRVNRSDGSKALPKEIECSIHIIVNGCPLGHIPFRLIIDQDKPAVVDQGAFSAQMLSQHIGKLPLEGQGKGALRYRDIILSYTGDDLDYVTLLADGLKLGGLRNVRMDRSSFSPAGEEWYEHFGAEIAEAECEAVLLCWSSNAAGEGEGTDGIRKEIELALKQEKLRPSFKLVPVMIGNEFIPLPKEIRSRWHLLPYFTLRESDRARRDAERRRKSVA